MIRLDKWLSENENISRNAAVALIESGNCTVNGIVITSKKYIVQENDDVILTIPEPEPINILAENIPLDIRYEDEELLIVCKPRGMVVHPAPGHCSGTLVNALMWHYDSQLYRAGIVHRIDKDTSGLLIIAKTDKSHTALSEQLAEHAILREYEAVVHGNVKQGGVINAPIGRSTSDRKKMCVVLDKNRNSREAITHYEVVETYGNYSHLRIKLQTGRTHQIRVHMAYRGHPVAGDCTYGNSKPASLNGQCLHAKKLGFTHPKSGEYIEIDSELPEYFTEFLTEIGC
ncbi:MAG: RluA family pseudouridine synthase [Oscillospiraceae bacterium]|nr:RluA family pseudouridine synthase [Oscillospiraceae bacterium]